MKDKLLAMVINAGMMTIGKLLTPEQLRSWGDALLDSLEDVIEKSDTEIDDKLVGPIIELIREAFGIADND